MVHTLQHRVVIDYSSFMQQCLSCDEQVISEKGKEAKARRQQNERTNARQRRN